MKQMHHTLQKELTRTLLVWSGAFFAFLTIVFLLSFNSLQGYILDLMAEHRLHYQTMEFAKHMDENDQKSIQEEGDALIEQPLISAILLIDASGRLLHTSIVDGEKPSLQLSAPVTGINLQRLVNAKGNLHLYMRQIPGHRTTLALIMDDRPVSIAIYATAAWSALLLLILVGLSLFGLHRVLKARLVAPVNRVRDMLDHPESDIPLAELEALEQQLPAEASDILDVYQHLKHSHDDLKDNIVNMMQALPACFWWSLDGKRYTGVSGKSSLILNTPPTEMQGQKLWSWGVGKFQRKSNRRQIETAIQEHSEHLDFAYQSEIQGDTRWFGENITICYDRKGSLECIYGIINDISTRKEQQQTMSEQMQMAERMDTTATLVGGIAHEFNNALAGMQGNLYLIRQQVDDEQSRVRLDRIESLIRRSADMIEQMLAFARKSQHQPKHIELARFLKNFEHIIRPTINNRIHFELEVGHHAEHQAIHADEGKLQEALTQLLHNAKQAVAHVKNPTIKLSMEPFDADDAFIDICPNLASRKLIHLCMQDNGDGIPDDVQKHIFEPFFTTREVGQGTGLGLPMVYGYIRQLGGCILVNSESGKGTAIDIYIPRRQSDIQTHEHSGEVIRGHGELILVVDDELIFRDAATEVLKGLGYQCIQARDGADAVQQFKQRQHDIHLILMDVVMPSLSGTQAAKRIRNINPDIPILFATAHDLTSSLNSHAYQAHTDMITKPFQISVLSQSINKLLNKAVNPKKAD